MDVKVDSTRTDIKEASVVVNIVQKPNDDSFLPPIDSLLYSEYKIIESTTVRIESEDDFYSM